MVLLWIMNGLKSQIIFLEKIEQKFCAKKKHQKTDVLISPPLISGSSLFPYIAFYTGRSRPLVQTDPH